MLCQFERLVYPSCVQAVTPSSYMVAVYRPCEKLKDAAGMPVTQIKAVGYCLPTSDKMRYQMQGRWSKNPKHGIQFEVENYEEIIIPTREGIIAYLSSGQIKGIGPKMAEKIYDSFGNLALEVLDKEPERLLSISGISERKLQKICESYLANRGARDVVAFLTPYGITPKRAVRLYMEYGDRTMDIVKNHPYQLCEMTGIGFRTADKIAMNMGFDSLSTERVDEGLLYTLIDAEGRGNLCMEKREFIKSCLKILDTPSLTEDMLANRAARLVHEGKLVLYDSFVFRQRTAQQEAHLASMIHRQLNGTVSHIYRDLEAELDKEEANLKVRFAPEQREAVKTALCNNLSIITGGPGTGKTMIQRAILNIYRRNNIGKEICCCAPTGRAARRMEQSTGHPASTVHRALGLLAGDDGDYNAPEMLEADLVLVDEISMLDTYLAGYLFDSVSTGTQMILIGDADQLPSVGPGAVLNEMLQSGRIPSVRLDKVFRQNAGSRIATNAKLIRHGTLSLEYGQDFQFVDSPSMADSAKIISKLYQDEIAKHGVDNVALLTPYRQKTETGVNALNEKLRELVNPGDGKKPEAICGKRVFRQGDKVMQVKNHDDVNNGDVGYITHIIKTAAETTVYGGRYMGNKRQVVEQTKQYAKKFVRYKEGAEKYSLGLTKFQELAKEAKAVYKIDGVALVNCEIFEKFLETFREY